MSFFVQLFTFLYTDRSLGQLDTYGFFYSEIENETRFSRKLPVKNQGYLHGYKNKQTKVQYSQKAHFCCSEVLKKDICSGW